MYQVTDTADFKLKPAKRPTNNSTLGGDWDPGIFLADSVEAWVNGYGYWRPWVVEFDVSGLQPGDYKFREGREVLVKAEAYPRLQLIRVVPLDAHCREIFGEYGWTEQFFETDFQTNEPIDLSLRFPIRGYHYPGDARNESADWQAYYKKRVKDYARKSGRGNGVYGRG